MRKLLIPLLLLVVAGVTILLVPDLALADGPSPDQNNYAICNQDKIEYGLWTILGRPTTYGTAFSGQRAFGSSWGDKPFIGFFIRFDDAVYDHCNEIPDYVEWWRCKKDAIDQDQAEVRAYLDSLGVDYHAYTILNMISVEEGDRDSVCHLSNYDEVVYMYPNYYLGVDNHSEIYGVNPSTREIKIRIFVVFDYIYPWVPVEEDAIINIPNVNGTSDVSDLVIGDDIYYIMNDDWVITRIIVLQDIPMGNP